MISLAMPHLNQLSPLKEIVMSDLINNLADAIEEFEDDICNFHPELCALGVVEDNRDLILELH
jgi:hypothetical protein